MANVIFSGSVVDPNGVSAPFSGLITVNTPGVGITSVTVVPQSAPAGTLRMITIVATGLSPLIYNLTVGGVAQSPNNSGVFQVVV